MKQQGADAPRSPGPEFRRRRSAMSEPSSEPSPGRSRPRLWHSSDNGAAPAGRPAPAPGRRKLYVALGLLLALLGATAAWLLYLRPLPPAAFLGGWIDQYRDARLPANAWAAQDCQPFEKLPWRHTNVFPNQELRLLTKVLGDLSKGDDLPVVVLLSAHAAADSRGQVCLLPGDARPDNEKTWLPLADVLAYLRACPARQKLLVLDLMKPYADPRAGLLTDDMAARAQAALKEAVTRDRRLCVLWACAPGQHSLSAPDLRHSAFAYYLLQGLGGRADGYGPDSR